MSSHSCEKIDPLVTPYVDGQLPDADRQHVDEHLRRCPPCHSRVAAERAVHDLLRARKGALGGACAPGALRARCVEFARSGHRPFAPSRTIARAFRPFLSAPRAAPIALAASLVLLVGAAFLYQLTAASSRVLAVELTADHLKCFAMDGLLHTPRATAAAVESSMLSGFGWQMQLPADASKAGLELVGARPCLYGEGTIAHIMYRHNGEPVSVYMLPESTRRPEVVEVLGHEAAIWCVGNRTFVLVARETRQEVDRIASFVRASLK